MKNLKVFTANHGGQNYYYTHKGWVIEKKVNDSFDSIERAARKIAREYLGLEVNQRWVSVSVRLADGVYTLKADGGYGRPTRKDVAQASLEFDFEKTLRSNA